MGEAKPFEDHRQELFGRADDVAALIARAQHQGLTAVVAEPQMGKSWLLNEVARFLSVDLDPPYLVGFYEQFGQTPDLLLRAIKDLYTRWLADASMRQQAKMVWEQQKGSLFGNVAAAITRILGKAAEDLGPVGAIFEEAIDGLFAANKTLTGGGVQLPRLQYEDARDLIKAVAQISGRRIALFLDQWEKSSDPRLEGHILEAFLRHGEDWPAGHVFMAMRPVEPAYGIVKRFEGGFPAARIYRLGSMRLEGSQKYLMLRSVRTRVAIASTAKDDDLIGLIDGFPNVIGRWTDKENRTSMSSLGDLRRVADDAHSFRYREFAEILPKLGDDLRRLAARLALLPIVADADAWRALKPDVLGTLNEQLCDDLFADGVLEQVDPPSFGHAKRADAARAWLIANRRILMRHEAEALILSLAGRIRHIAPDISWPAAGLRGLNTTAEQVGVAQESLCLTAAAATLFEDRIDPERLQGKTAAASAAPLVAMGLFNTLNHAKDESDLDRRDDLLNELRRLAQAYPDDDAVREKLAMGLLNTLYYAKDENDLGRRDDLLDDLRRLAQAYPDDDAVRKQLAKGLFNTLTDASDENDLRRRDDLFELRELAQAYPEDDVVQEALRRAEDVLRGGD
ncbi:MAG: hypothetical protein U1E66_02635 [Rhodospirillales bacterium]